MAKKRQSEQSEFEWDPGTANPKQKQFYASRKMFTAFGGAKGGGKTHAVRTKAMLGAYHFPGIKILIMRRMYPELQSNHIEPMLKILVPELASYNGTHHTIYFENGSLIHFGHWNGDESELEYNGQEYDWIFIDEATQFSFRTFQFLKGLLRGVNKIPKRMYLTANPGGIGHRWFKRLFIDKDYIVDTENPEANENPQDYCFIPATIEDNTALLNSPGGEAYKQMLSQMPENLRRAYRYGIWEELGGSYFPEFSDAKHCVEPFPIPPHWKRYRAFDYGLDLFACGWFAVDENGRSYMYREYSAKNLIVKEAARTILDHTLPGEDIVATFAPPDVWNRQKDTGKTMAEVFMLSGVPIIKADNNRVQGHLLVKEALAAMPDGRPGLVFFRGQTKQTCDDVKDIQADDKNPNDCAKEPHEVTHRVDALRYFCISRKLIAEVERAKNGEEDDEDTEREDYEHVMTGGPVSAAYLNYGG